MRVVVVIKRSLIILTLYTSLSLFLFYLRQRSQEVNNKRQCKKAIIEKLNHCKDEDNTTSSKEIRYEEYIDEKREFCKPQRYVGYLKVHKTGSTTIMNVFLRYGIRNNLTFVLPREGRIVNLCSPGSLQIKNLPKLNGEYFNILTHHARFNLTGFRDVLGPAAVFVGSLRDPLSAFLSTFNHFRLSVYRGLPSVHAFLQEPQKYENITRRFANPLTKNFQSFHYGFERYIDISPQDLQRKTQELESEFLLIIIAEYFPESLVLLKRLLCWKLKDIAYINLNVRNYTSKTDTFSQAEMDNFNKLHVIDQYLYNHFNKTLWRKIKKQGPDFNDELHVFKNFSQFLLTYCTSEFKPESATFYDEFNKIDITLRGPDCDVMGAKNQDVTRALKIKQYPSLSEIADYKINSIFNISMIPNKNGMIQ